ncbi:MAG: hypothetical protein ACOX1P_09720 [Thermoguttaceae bacterium]
MLLDASPGREQEHPSKVCAEGLRNARRAVNFAGPFTGFFQEIDGQLAEREDIAGERPVLWSQAEASEPDGVLKLGDREALRAGWPAQFFLRGE